MIMVAFAFRVNLRWVGKAELFNLPIGFLLRFFGGIPVYRSANLNTVTQAIRVIDGMSDIVLSVAPEGTRKKTTYWKTGFYHIAAGANVPIVMGYLDYGYRRSGVGPAFFPTGALETDFSEIESFYEPFTGRYSDYVISF